MHSYSLGARFFKTYHVTEGAGKKLIEVVVHGPVSLGQSISEKGEPVYYVTKEGEEFTSLQPHQYQLSAFFAGYLPDYNEFVTSTQKRPFYEFKSLAEFVSAYNTYKHPDKYVAERYKSPEQVGVFAFGSVNASSLSFKNESKEFSTAATLSVGAILHYKYHRKLFLVTPVLYQRASFSSQANEVQLYHLLVEPHFVYRFYINEPVTFSIGPGLGLSYDLNSQVRPLQAEESIKDKVDFEKVGVGYNLNASLDYKARYMLGISFSSYKIRTHPFEKVEIETSGKKGSYQTIRFGLGYKL
ncbi:hypothetical protein [Rufibacter psychrotolerans]|uniref:hypothetical protein n=1 Tax=Rufibacter psychrotolerans TaxID=2812556 RepID=UPI001967A0CF|nr:hypothetical protein [Rufibacter sp. SYSU D00308]